LRSGHDMKWAFTCDDYIGTYGPLLDLAALFPRILDTSLATEGFSATFNTRGMNT